MTPPQPATPETALQVPATPTTPLPTAATGTSNQVLATGATSPKKRKGGRVLITVDEAKDVAPALYQQVQGIAPDEVRIIESADALRAMMAEYSSIDHLSMVMHMIDNDLLLGWEQRTLSQTQSLLDGSVPPIARWSFDGCSLGRGVGSLYAFAAHFGVARVEGWTHFHDLDFWGKAVWGTPSASQIAAIHTEVERASNFLPKGDAGASYSASELEATMQQGRSINLVCEFFTYDYEPDKKFDDVLNDPGWVDATSGQPVLQPWNAVRNPVEACYPRTAAVTRVVSSADDAAALEADFASRPVLYRVVILPPVGGR